MQIWYNSNKTTSYFVKGQWCAVVWICLEPVRSCLLNLCVLMPSEKSEGADTFNSPLVEELEVLNGHCGVIVHTTDARQQWKWLNQWTKKAGERIQGVVKYPSIDYIWLNKTQAYTLRSKMHSPPQKKSNPYKHSLIYLLEQGNSLR